MPEASRSLDLVYRGAEQQRCVFVYGTLRQGGDNDITRLAPAPQFVGVGVIRGRMYDLGAYPGVILAQDGPDSGHDVIGEVYAIEPALERKLDEIEMLYPAQTDEYSKQEVAVAIGSRLLACLVYAINPAYVKNRRLVPGGDWLKG